MTDTAAAAAAGSTEGGQAGAQAGAAGADGAGGAGTGEQLTPEQKAAAEQAAAHDKEIGTQAVEAFKATLPKAPEKYDLKLPEQSANLDAKLVERTGAIARDLGLSQDAAQKMLDAVVKEVGSHHQAALEAYKPGGKEWTKQVDGWEAVALADTEIGGTADALKTSGELGKRVLATFGSESLYKFLHETGFGSHPDVIRFLRRVGKAMDEGSLVTAGAQDEGAPSLADKLYGKKKPDTQE